MIGRVRELLAVPFAAPPQARRRTWRLLPEAAAGTVYAVWLLAGAVLALLGEPGPFAAAARWAYLTAVLAATGLPAATAAAAMAAERDGGTLEDLVLLPINSGDLAWGRYWHLVASWLRFLGWLLPLYVVCTAGVSVPGGGDFAQRAAWGFWALSPGPVMAALPACFPDGAEAGLGGSGVWALALRLGTDALGVGLAAAAGMFVSSRFRASGAALATAPLAALALALGLAGAPTWAALAVNRMTAGGGGGRLAALFLLWAALGVCAQLLLVRLMVGAAARGLERGA